MKTFGWWYVGLGVIVAAAAMQIPYSVAEANVGAGSGMPRCCDAKIVSYTAESNAFNFKVDSVKGEANVCSAKAMVHMTVTYHMKFTVSFVGKPDDVQVVGATCGSADKQLPCGLKQSFDLTPPAITCSDSQLKDAAKSAAAALPKNKGMTVTQAEPIGSQPVAIVIGGTILCTNAAGDIAQGKGPVTGPPGVLALDANGTAAQESFPGNK